jgi:hypothetical protein
MGGARDHVEPLLAAQPGLGLAVEVEDELVAAADDQQRRRPHAG